MCLATILDSILHMSHGLRDEITIGHRTSTLSWKVFFKPPSFWSGLEKKKLETLINIAGSGKKGADYNRYSKSLG